ncbi:MAG: hypothetical protein WD011_07820 [Nitriliruptoraceae bacterium]
MATWQWTLTAFIVLLPFALMLDFWPDRERCDARGRPQPRTWRPTPTSAPLETDEHH